MAQFARVTSLGWRQGDDATAQARVGGSGWYQADGAGGDPSGSASGALAPVNLTAANGSASVPTVDGNASGAIASLSLTAATGSASAPIASIDLSNSLTHVLKNNAGMPFASVAFRCIIVDALTGSLAAVKTGTTDSGGLIGVLSDGALVAGDDYYVIVEPGTGGAYGLYLASAA